MCQYQWNLQHASWIMVQTIMYVCVRVCKLAKNREEGEMRREK